jgi:hypothetical protein
VTPRLLLSKLPRFRGTQRLISRAVWGRWLSGFLFWELTGTRRLTPWRTLSETAWDIEEQRPGAVRLLQGFLLGLTIHIRYRTTLKSSVEFGLRLQADFDAWVEGKEGYGDLARVRACNPRPLVKP